MKEGILQIEDASFEIIEKMWSSGEQNIESYFNVNLKRVKFNILNAISKIFSENDKINEFF